MDQQVRGAKGSQSFGLRSRLWLTMLGGMGLGGALAGAAMAWLVVRQDGVVTEPVRMVSAAAEVRLGHTLEPLFMAAGTEVANAVGGGSGGLDTGGLDTGGLDTGSGGLGESSGMGARCGTMAASSRDGRHPLELVSMLMTPQAQIEKVWNGIGPTVMASMNPQPWPEIHPRSQQAQVPVVMYHDILPEKQVFFDVTPAELRQDFELIRDRGLTPISLDQLVNHLRTGLPLPEQPVVLTFDDGYVGHYEHVYPLLEEFGYPAVFSIFTAKVDGEIAGRSTVTWEHLQEMAQSPLVTIAAHSISHPRDLGEVENDGELRREVEGSKRRIEAQLGVPVRYFTYPEGKYDERVMEAVEAAGYGAALTMDDVDERFAGESENLLAIARFGQSQLERVAEDAWGGPPPLSWSQDFNSEVRLDRLEVDEVPLVLISGGRPMTIHADSRYQVPEIIAGTSAIAAVDGGFFSMKYLDSNTMIGPVYSQHTREFVPGNPGENLKLRNRPLVLINDEEAKFVPFDPARHNTLEGMEAEHPGVTDGFVGAAWLVKDGQPRSPATFSGLFDFDAERHRAFWGINQSGQPVIGVTAGRVDSVSLGEALSQAGLQDAVMLDSGASTSLAYEGESLVGYVPRPVPHVVALVPPNAEMACTAATKSEDSELSESSASSTSSTSSTSSGLPSLSESAGTPASSN